MSEEDGPYQTYDDKEGGKLLFTRRCPACGRIVKADATVRVNGLGEYVPRPNADCSRCGRVEMAFQGFF
jgi:ribosomal protein S27AE